MIAAINSRRLLVVSAIAFQRFLIEAINTTPATWAGIASHAPSVYTVTWGGPSTITYSRSCPFDDIVLTVARRSAIRVAPRVDDDTGARRPI